MTDQEFCDLLIKWEKTPECQEYYKYCDQHGESPSDKETIKCFKLMSKALNTELGKQLITEKRFQQIFT